MRRHADGMTIECRLRKELLNFAGVLHGGVTATLADVAVGQALAKRLGRFGAFTTAELQNHHLRPITNRQGTAASPLPRRGKTLCLGPLEGFHGAKKYAPVS